MSHPLSEPALNQLFLTARTRNAWSSQPVSDAHLRQLYDLMKMGPTSANCSPARFVWLRTPEGKGRLAALADGANQPKILAAPVTVIIGYDLGFADKLRKLLPAAAEFMMEYFQDPQRAESTAFRNGTLQGAYLILAARALGLDAGPMSGFDNPRVDAEFFAGTRIKSNFICSLGYGTDENLYPRHPRLGFDESGRLE
jgi:3-hydroxypropanoate dehydrogenase